MRIAVTLVLPILLILSLLGVDFLSPATSARKDLPPAPSDRPVGSPLSHAMDDLRPAGPAEYRWLLAVQERERRLLAQAMHDDIGQYLTGIRTQLLLLRCTAGDGQPALARLERYCQGLDDSFRALLRGLPPPALQRQSLDEALRACVADWQEGQGIACELRLGGPLPPLDAAAGTHLYRLLQEALNNVAGMPAPAACGSACNAVAAFST